MIVKKKQFIDSIEAFAKVTSIGLICRKEEIKCSNIINNTRND